MAGLKHAFQHRNARCVVLEDSPGDTPVTTKLAIFAALAALLVIVHRLPAQTRALRATRFLLIALVVVTPLLLDQRPRIVVLTCLLLVFLALEYVAQRNRYDFVSDAHVRTATYTIIARGTFLAAGYYGLDQLNGVVVPWGLEASHAPIWLQATVIFLVVDFVRYGVHYLQHKFDFWWSFHKIHHSTTEVSALVAGQNHLLDGLLTILIFPTLTAYLLGVRADVFLFAYQIPNIVIASAYAHANINFPKTKAWWAYILSSPNAHAHHHTRLRNRTNFGNTTLIWDWIFGTLEIPREAPSDFGITEPEIAKLGIVAQTLHPFGIKLPTFRNDARLVARASTD
jgi:sterol desaturase/sphingolipid hydroxylase (fatty acid hydroxylase superfamily)